MNQDFVKFQLAVSKSVSIHRLITPEDYNLYKNILKYPVYQRSKAALNSRNELLSIYFKHDFLLHYDYKPQDLKSAFQYLENYVPYADKKEDVKFYNSLPLQEMKKEFSLQIGQSNNPELYLYYQNILIDKHVIGQALLFENVKLLKYIISQKPVDLIPYLFLINKPQIFDLVNLSSIEEKDRIFFEGLTANALAKNNLALPVYFVKKEYITSTHLFDMAVVTGKQQLIPTLQKMLK